MAERKETPNETGSNEPIVYASPTKRVWAWVGVAYMVIVTLLVTYFLAKAKFISGIGTLMLIPALCGLGATSILRYRSGEGKGGLATCVILVALCVILVAVNLVTGVPALITNF